MSNTSFKKQIYEQIANQQVQKALAEQRQQEIAQLQARYDEWQKDQAAIAQLQTQFDEWKKANAPQPTAQPVQKAEKYVRPTIGVPDGSSHIPSIVDYVNMPGNQNDKKKAAETIAKEEERRKLRRGDIASDITDKIAGNVIPEKEAFEKSREDKKFREDYQRQQQEEQIAAGKKSIKTEKENKPTITVDKVDQWLSPDYKLSDKDKIEAKKYAQSELQKYDYNSNKKPILSSEEDRQHYADMVNLLNKTNTFTNTMAGVIKQPYNLGKAVRDAGNSIIDQLTGLGAAISDKTGLTNEATKQHNEKVAKKEAFNKQNDASINRMLEGAKTQNPVATTAGEIGGQIGMYALTNPLFDSLGAAAGLGKAGSFALNQVGQNAQDLALDTIPMLNNYLEGGVTDEEKKELLKNVGINAVGNLVMGAAGEGLSAIAKNRAAKKAADEAFRTNVLESAGNLSKVANEVPGIEDIDNVVGNATRQYEEAAKNIENISKQIPELPKEEIKLSDAEINGLLSKMEPVRPGGTPKVSPAIENEAEALSKQMDLEEVTVKQLELPQETQELLLSDFEEIYGSLDKMNAAAEASGNAKAIEKFEKLQKAVFDYENAAWKSDSIEEVNTAKKAADAARQSFIREMKKADSNYKGELTGTKLGQAKYRRDTMKMAEQEAQELADSIIKSENDLKSAKSQNVPGANPLQFFADKQPSFEDQMKTLKRREIEAKLDLNEQAMKAIQSGYDAEGRMVTDVGDAEKQLVRLNGERAYLEKQLAAINTAEENEDEALDALTNYVSSQKQTAPPGGNGPSSNTSDSANNMLPMRISNNPPIPPDNNPPIPEEQWKISKWRTNTAENQGWGDELPIKDYAYRVFTEAEQRAAAVERYEDVENVYSELMNTNQFDEVDVKMAMSEMQRLMDEATPQSLRQAQRLGTTLAHQGRESGRAVQAFAEYNRNTAAGALTDASRAQDDLIIEPWKTTNKKKAEGNSRIARALADMGNKWKTGKSNPELTHDQIKKGVIAELNREVGSVEQYFNDNDIEFLTQLAEDKSIPVWQITSEIEHKLNTGDWYTLDESLPIPQPTNRKLQNALNSLVTEQIRAEKAVPTLKEITNEVRNTLGKESADFESLFSDDDIDYLANLINNGASKQELADALNLKMATGSFGISDETLQEVNNIFKQISQYDPDSKQFVEGQAEAYRLLANEIVPDASPLEKFEAWRYIAMLGNPKTMLRNFIGNQTFGAVTGISNNVAAVAEAGIDKGLKALGGNGIQRTKSVLNPIADSGLIKAAAEDADASRYRQMIGSKYEKMDKDTLRRSKSVFKSKLAQLYEKVTDAGISDYQAVKNKFSTSLAGYLKANGYDANIFKAETELQRLKNLSETQLLSDAQKAQMESLTKDVETLEKARDYALKQAEYATFHEDNAVANLLTKFSREARNSDNIAAKGLGTIIEGVVPFKKTPANVLRSGVEYSPLGAIDSIRRTGKLIYENTGKRAGQLADVYTKKGLNGAEKEIQKELAADVIDSWAKTLTGTGLTALGFYLYDKGILHSSDPDTKYQDELEGHQNYSIEINGKSYTIDWAAPTVMPLMVGAEIAKLWDSTGKGSEDFLNNIDGYVAAANRIADPIVETSMLSGVKDTLETAANAAQYNENLNIPALIAYNALTGYATQGVPTIAGQVARTIDPTRRSSYTDKEGVAGVLDKQLKKQMNKIPGLSTLNQPYVDTYGREQQNSPFNNVAGNLAYQMLSPGYLSNINETEADRISREAYEVGKNTSTLPKWQSSFKNAEGQRVSPEEYTTAAKAYGEANYSIRDSLAKTDWFNNLDDAQKEEIVKGINTVSQHIGKAAIDPEYTTSAKAYQAYKEGGVDGLIDYYKKENDKSIANQSGLSSTSNASKAIQEDLAKGKTEAAQEKIEAAVTLQDLGLTKPGPSYTYYHAQEVIPGLTAEDFAKTFKAIDADGNQGIKQDEVIDYLNKKKITSQSEANKIWNAYGNSNWKSIPSLNDGTWSKKKK